MTEERTSIIDVGDEMQNDVKDAGVIIRLERGRHGLLFIAESPAGYGQIQGFLPYELPPTQERIKPWHGWSARAHITLANGAKLAVVCFRGGVGNSTLADYEAEWNRTIKAMKAEEGVMQSRPTNIRMAG